MEIFGQFSLLDVLDIAVVAFIFYRLFLLVSGTRAAQMFFGLAVLIVLSAVAQWLRLNGINWIISSLKTVWVIAFVILFQPELRQALVQIGHNRIFRRFIPTEEYSALGEIVKAAEKMAEDKIGALIVLERSVGLKNYVETGTPLDSRVSAELLVTIFTPPSPLHDGAVIILGDRIVAAGCILPLSQDPNIVSAKGTRHRAALGLAEETDAVVVVVSEETRDISVARKGKLEVQPNPGALRSELATIFGERKEPAPGRQAEALT
jgi:diadenylate cyclase